MNLHAHLGCAASIGSNQFIVLAFIDTMTSNQFSACTLIPYEVAASPSLVKSTKERKWAISSFYLDSSGRASIALPLQLQFPSKQIFDCFVSSGCIKTGPENTPLESTEESNATTKKEVGNEYTPCIVATPTNQIAIEAKVTLTFGTAEAIAARVEGVTVLHTKIEESLSSVIFNTEINIRVSRTEGGKIDLSEASNVKTNVDVTATFTEVFSIPDDRTQEALNILDSLSRSNLTNHKLSSLQRASTHRLKPFELNVALTHALSISVRSVPGPSMGETFLAITMAHSNTYQDPVCITNIALHPGITRQLDKDPTDLSSSVLWGYAPHTEPGLPLTLLPNESHSVILTVEAREDSQSRRYHCPLSISATIGGNENCHIVVATDTDWTTSRVATEPSDSFLIEMSVDTESKCVVGSPWTINLEISNLSIEARQLMLIVDTKDFSSNSTRNASSSRWTIVSEKKGSRFGVAGPDDRGDQELLVIDAALVLGDIKGQSSTKARLRVIPLREGSLSIPNFKLVDNRSGKRYHCVHRFHAVAQLATVKE